MLLYRPCGHATKRNATAYCHRYLPFSITIKKTLEYEEREKQRIIICFFLRRQLWRLCESTSSSRHRRPISIDTYVCVNCRFYSNFCITNLPSSQMHRSVAVLIARIDIYQLLIKSKTNKQTYKQTNKQTIDYYQRQQRAVPHRPLCCP